MKLLNNNEEQTLLMILPALKPGFKAHALELLGDSDPTGGMVAIDDQVKSLHDQYVATWGTIDD